MKRPRSKSPQLTLEFIRLAGPWRMQKKLAAALKPALPDLMARSAKLPGGAWHTCTFEVAESTAPDALAALVPRINGWEAASGVRNADGTEFVWSGRVRVMLKQRKLVSVAVRVDNSAIGP